MHPSHDPMITALFPEASSILFPENAPPALTADGLGGLSPLISTNMLPGTNYINGEFDVSNTFGHYSESFYPSATARRYLLYLQLVASATFSSRHYTKRKDLLSFLLLQTFHGCGKLIYDGKEYHLKPDDVFLIDCRMPHEYVAEGEDGWGYRFVHFDGNNMPGMYNQFFSGGNIVFHFEEDSEFQQLMRSLLRLGKEKNPNQEILAHRLLTDLISELICHLPRYQADYIPDIVRREQMYLEEHCREKVSLDEMAEHFAVSKYRMSREFSKYTGQSPIAYHLDCRIDLGRRLLRYTEMPIGEVSDFVGFDDHNGFYRAFMKREEMSPSDYRKQWRQL